MNEIINTNLIRLCLKTADKEEAIRRMAKLIEQNGNLDSYDDYVEAVLTRENKTSTVVGSEIAIPHGKSKGVKIKVETQGAVGIENEITNEDIKEKAADVNISKADRFKGKPKLNIEVQKAIKYSDQIIDKIVKNLGNKNVYEFYDYEINYNIFCKFII